ncbi:tripartite tricarboxylate transporter substrate binding protein [Aquabacter spiritensis]|uniref:Tripartite-type tricarboxylate transporter receptor subunit TctC n=1 Tax=Aquabacter spiritensis TaxID=933073 RepID=A0A4R3M085_9HYPH|nr:tripartite tricarboxylate transporter substrate binding protein [Aquabacter spiritensis]TCT06113.1 tripartite-type tricarboxylate transporter receptor subunit TctC [Aquabacter spiritensis]
MKILWKAAMALAIGAAGALPAAAQDKFPSKAIEIIVPFAAGGSTDLGMRVIAPALEAKWGVPVRIINKPGGNTVPAVNEVMNAKPDGYTMLADGPPQSSMLDTAVKNLPFKVVDRTFVGVAAYTPMKFVVPVDSPFKTLADAAAAAKADPSTFTWTSLGGAGAQDMANRQFFKAIGVDVTKTRPLQLKGGSEAITMTAGGHVKMGVGSYSSIAAPLQSGKLRVLAVASPERWPNLPDTPTAKEAGYPSIETLYWIGLSGPPKLPADIVAAYDKAMREITSDPKVVDGLLKVGLLPLYANAADMLKRVEKERAETQELWAK